MVNLTKILELSGFRMQFVPNNLAEKEMSDLTVVCKGKSTEVEFCVQSRLLRICDCNRTYYEVQGVKGFLRASVLPVSSKVFQGHVDGLEAAVKGKLLLLLEG